MAKGFSFNGQHSNDFGIIMRSKKRPLLPKSRDAYENIPGRHGSVLKGGKLEDIYFDLACAVEFSALTDLRTLAHDIAEWLYSTDREELIFDDDPDIMYRAKVDGQSDLENYLAFGSFPLLFRAEPFAYDAIETAAQIATAGIVTNNGILDVSPLLTLLLSGSVSNLTITNNTTGESCVITGVLAGGSIVEIDGGYQTVKTVKIDGSNGLARFSGAWPRLVAGENQITVSNSNAAATFSFRGMRR